jgi:hypothetical protein
MALFHSFGAAGYTTTFISIDVFARTFPLINVAIADRAKEPFDENLEPMLPI